MALFDDCSPESPCYGCLMEWYRQQVAAGPPKGDDPVALVRYAAMCEVVARGLEVEAKPKQAVTEEVPF